MIIFRYHIPLDPKTMKNEGFRPSNYGSQPLKMKVVGSHGSFHVGILKFDLRTMVRPKMQVRLWV